MYVTRSTKLVVQQSDGKLGRISGLATVEDPAAYDPDEVVLIRCSGITRSSPVIPITYEHPRGVITTIGQADEFEVVKTHDDKPALKFSGDLYLKLPRAKEVYDVATEMADAGNKLSLFVSVEGDAKKADVVPLDGGGLDVRSMRLDSLAVTAAPKNRRSAWGLGADWMPVAASMMATYGEQAFLDVLREVAKGKVHVTASGVGYPEQGTSTASQPGTELAQLVPQSMNAVNRRYTVDTYIVETLKAYPQLTWKEGEAVTRNLIALLNRKRP